MHVCALHIDSCSSVSTDIVLRSVFEEIMTLSVLKACLCVYEKVSVASLIYEAVYEDSSSVLIAHILESERQSCVD